MVRDIFMVEDHWGLYKYWLNPNYTESANSTSNLTNSNTTRMLESIYENDAVFQPLCHSLPMMNADIDEYDTLQAVLLYTGS